MHELKFKTNITFVFEVMSKTCFAICHCETSIKMTALKLSIIDGCQNSNSFFLPQSKNIRILKKEK